MKIVYEDLLRFLQKKPSLEDLSATLFQLGHEHEIKNNIFDIDFTPNRGDCLSLLGLSRDLNYFYDFEGFPDIYDGEIKKLALDFKNSSPESCQSAYFLKIEIEEIPNQYLDYVESYFSNLEINKNNFFADLTNYLSYEIGQPLHAYDFETLGKEIIFEEKQCNESFDTLIDQKIKLSGRNCVFVSRDKIINLAGVIGGKHTACSKNTKVALIECANFSPQSIIGKALKYNINSEAAYKFERGIDSCIQENAIRRLIKIVDEHASIIDFSFIKYENEMFEERFIKTNHEEINKILGTNLSESSFLDKLKKLEFCCESDIKIPSHRNDIFSKNDIAEEVARLIGYNNIQSEEINIKSSDEDLSEKFYFLKNLLIQNGFNEVINYPFIEKEEDESISIDNPIDSNKRFLRTQIFESLIENLLYNERRQKDSIKLFEFSDIYTKNQTKRKLGIIATGRRGYNHEEFSKQIDEDYLHSLFENTELNDFFRFKAIDRKNLDTKLKSKIYFAEVELDKLDVIPFMEDNRNYETFTFNKFKPISDFPASTRDFSFSVKNPSKFRTVLEELTKMEHQDLKKSFIFDFYKNTEKGEIKLGIRMVFQSEKKTLSDDEINTYISELIEPLLKLDDVSIPGY